MRKRGISAVVPAVLIAVMTIAECFCSSVPTHAQEANNDLQSSAASTGSTSKDYEKKIEVKTEQNNTEKDNTTHIATTSIDNSSKEPEKENLDIPAKQPVNDTKEIDQPKKIPQLIKREEFSIDEDQDGKEQDEEDSGDSGQGPQEENPGEGDTKESPKLNVTFRILDSTEGEIDESTAYSTGNSYIAEIEVNDAIEEGIRSKFTPSVSDGGNNDNTEGIILQNSVASSLSRYPTADEIKEKCSFDPNTQYIAWYYINSEYYDDIYVDGVIRKRSIPIISNGPVPDVTIHIETACNTPAFEYDGEDHYIGGFNITVADNNSTTNYVTSFFDALGRLIKQEVHAGENGSGTYFSHNGIRYWVNIDAAYVVAKQIGSYEIPFIFDNKVIAPENIVVKVVDDKGNVISSIPSTQIAKKEPSSNQFKVTSRKITIEAGTTVQNYSGETITNKNVTITSGSLLKGHSLVDVVINGSQSGIGSSVNEITSYRIVDENGNDVTKYYDVKCVNGKLVLVDGHNSKKSSNSNDDSTPVTTGIKEKALPKKAVIIGGKTMEKTSSENNNKILGVSRIARMSKTFDESNINLRLLIILLAAGTAIYLSQIKVKE